MEIKKYALPVLFLMLLLLHGLDSYLDIIPEPELQERRGLAEKPELKITYLDPFPRDYEAYYNDHFNWRNYFIRAGAYLNYHAFRQSALPSKVLIGRAGWLYKSGFQMDMYRGKFRFSPHQLEMIRRELEHRRQKVVAVGGKYYLCIPPMKPNIYPEYLPEQIRKINPESCARQLANYLQDNTTINYIDLYRPLLALKDKSPFRLYLQTDHHWTDYAGMAGAKVILDRLREDFPAIPPLDTSVIRFNTVTYDGMLLAQMLGLAKEMPETFPLMVNPADSSTATGARPYPIPADFPFPDEYCIVKTTAHTNLPKLMMVRESFANPMVAILGDHFRESIFIFDNWKHRLNEDILLQEKPDIFIQIIWEGMIYNLLPNPPKEAGW